MPTAIAKKINTISSEPCNTANPAATPKNGAVHGVASKVANAPVRKSPDLPLAGVFAIQLVKLDGKLISNFPAKLAANSVIAKIIKMTKIGS